MYSIVKDFLAHQTSVTSIEFSPDGSYLASGDDGGLLVVSMVPGGEECARFRFEDSVTALVWTGNGKKLVVGLANCRLHFLFLDDETTYSVSLAPPGYDDLPLRWRDKFQINCLAYNAGTDLLAIGVGVSVQVISSPTSTTYIERCTIAPFDPEVPSLEAARSSIPPTGLPAEVRSIHFVDNGKAVVVTFLEEGIRCYDIDTQVQRWYLRPKRLRIGKSAIDRQGKHLVCSNLYDGFDLYNISNRKSLRWLRRVHQETAPNQNVILPVIFVHDGFHDGSSVLLGSTCGNVVLSSLGTPPEVERLDHDADLVVALAATTSPGEQPYIATACGEKEAGTYVRLWKKGRTQGGLRQPGRIMVSKSVYTDMEKASSQESIAKTSPEDLRQAGKAKAGRTRTTRRVGAGNEWHFMSYVSGIFLGAFMVLISTLPVFDQLKAKSSQAMKPIRHGASHQVPFTLSYLSYPAAEGTREAHLEDGQEAVQLEHGQEALHDTVLAGN